MRSLSPSELLSVWERGADSAPAAQAALLLAAACPKTPPEELARLSVGQRDALLLELRERLLGNRLDCRAECPACQEPLEWSGETADLLVKQAHPQRQETPPSTGAPASGPASFCAAQVLAGPEASAPTASPSPAVLDALHPNRSADLQIGSSEGISRHVRADLEICAPNDRIVESKLETAIYRLISGGCEVHFRLPTVADLAELSPQAGDSQNRDHLLRACLLSATRDGRDLPLADLPATVAAAVVQRMAELDPQADVQFDLCCPQCGHRWNVPLDIVSFFWTELQALAVRLLREVHDLATAYGWSEAEILSLTPRRRQAYLELIQP